MIGLLISAGLLVFLVGFVSGIAAKVWMDDRSAREADERWARFLEHGVSE